MGGAAARPPQSAGRGRREEPVRPVRLTSRRAAPWWVGGGGALLALLAAAAPARAQAACDGRRIDAILIDARTVYSDDDSLIPPFIRALGNSLHWQTKEATVRADLLFAVGDPCEPLRLAETERLLRARPYIRSATVLARPDRDGGVQVLVQTRDEFSLEVRLRLSGPGFPVRRALVTEDNLSGGGLHVQALYNNFGRRPAFYGDVLDHHFLGKRVEAEAIGGKSEVGPVFEESVRRAFESEFDRLAWRESLRYRKQPFPLVSTAVGTILEPLVELGGDAGAAVRIGRPGALEIAGLLFTMERLHVESPTLGPSPDQDSLAAALVGGRFRERRDSRIHLVLGAREIVFHPHHGVDAVRAIEDVPEGAQVGLVVGKSLFGGGGFQHDWFSAAEVLAGRELGADGLLFSRAKVEGRYVTPDGRWDGVLADGEVLVYDIRPRSTVVLAVQAAGGWRTLTPFQLLLGGQDGLRGYGSSTLPVGRRIVVHLEDRVYLGSAFGFADLGAVGFAETGRGWAGDAIFGENTGMLGSVGVGLRLASPRGSRRTYGFDLTQPLSRGLGPEFRFTVGQQFGVARGEPGDVVRSRERVSSVTVFDFPRF